jgi:hypothetical protein
LPVYYREGQSKFYAKKGISWHVTVVSINKVYDNSTVKDNNDDDDDEEEKEEEEEERAPISCDDDDDDDKQRVIPMKGTRLDHHVFVHVFDQVIQDSEAVLAIISDILKQIKVNHPTIDRAYIRCDNAGCYHSARTILSLPAISRASGITIERIDFSEPQGGKGKTIKLFLTRKKSAVIKNMLQLIYLPMSR